MTHGVIGNTLDFDSKESWFEPRWVNIKKSEHNRSFSQYSLSNSHWILFMILKN
jgi:hypothetical protein